MVPQLLTLYFRERSKSVIFHQVLLPFLDRETKSFVGTALLNEHFKHEHKHKQVLSDSSSDG